MISIGSNCPSSGMNDTAKGGLTQFQELLPLFLALLKIPNVNIVGIFVFYHCYFIVVDVIVVILSLLFFEIKTEGSLELEKAILRFLL